jgi:hypothetical protein
MYVDVGIDLKAPHYYSQARCSLTQKVHLAPPRWCRFVIVETEDKGLPVRLGLALVGHPCFGTTCAILYPTRKMPFTRLKCNVCMYPYKFTKRISGLRRIPAQTMLKHAKPRIVNARDPLWLGRMVQLVPLWVYDTSPAPRLVRICPSG